MSESLTMHLEFPSAEEKERFKLALAAFVKRWQSSSPNDDADQLQRLLSSAQGVSLRLVEHDVELTVTAARVATRGAANVASPGSFQASAAQALRRQARITISEATDKT